MDLVMLKEIKCKEMLKNSQDLEIIHLLRKKCMLLQEVGHFQKAQEKINIGNLIL